MFACHLSATFLTHVRLSHSVICLSPVCDQAFTCLSPVSYLFVTCLSPLCHLLVPCGSPVEHLCLVGSSGLFGAPPPLIYSWLRVGASFIWFRQEWIFQPDRRGDTRVMDSLWAAPGSLLKGLWSGLRRPGGTNAHVNKTWAALSRFHHKSFCLRSV